MAETQLDLNQPQEKPKNRSTGALILFLFLALPMPICMGIYHFVLWSTQQSAIASGSLASLTWAGPIGLAVQAFVMSGVIAALWYLTNDDRFKPVYAGWLGAALMAFPALALKFFGPNNDQLGSIYQIVICLIAFLIVSRVRKIRIDWKAGNISTITMTGNTATGGAAQVAFSAIKCNLIAKGDIHGLCYFPFGDPETLDGVLMPADLQSCQIRLTDGGAGAAVALIALEIYGY